MGFFSWNCKGCEESIKAPYNIPENIKWQNDCVLVREDKDPLIGQYDGYGRIDDYEITWETEEPELWHEDCWMDEDRPMYTGSSRHAADQGFFYDYPEKA
jgi:hypothetical protein